jgi:hypothetical protein
MQEFTESLGDCEFGNKESASFRRHNHHWEDNIKTDDVMESFAPGEKPVADPWET